MASSVERDAALIAGAIVADDYNKPNVSLDLAPSYDTRKVLSRVQMQSGIDQRKVNCFYDLIKNETTGRMTLELVKRPGVASRQNVAAVSGAQYLINNVTSALLSTWVISWDGTVTTASDASVSATVLSDTSYSPAYIDTTIISGTTYAVLQLRTANATAQKVYFASAANSWTEITDADFAAFTPRGKAEHLDGYMFVLDTASRVQNSDLNSLSAWTAGNYLTKQIQSDQPIGLAKFKNRILAFGRESCEVMVNAGNATGSPLRTVPELSAKVGMGQIADPNVVAHGYTHYYCTVNDKMYFIGRTVGDPYSSSLYMYDGSQFHKISSGPLDRILQDATSTVIYSISKFTFYGKNAVAIQMTAPSVSTQKWLMYFPDSNEWFEWESDVFTPVNDGEKFLAKGLTSVMSFGQANSWVDNVSGTYTMTVQFRMPKNGNNRDFMDWCAVEADTVSVNLAASFSDNDYSSFSTARNIDLSTAEKRITRCGSYKTRAVRLTNADNAEVRIRKFMARVR
jgi:hypothetical protein